MFSLRLIYSNMQRGVKQMDDIFNNIFIQVIMKTLYPKIAYNFN